MAVCDCVGVWVWLCMWLCMGGGSVCVAWCGCVWFRGCGCGWVCVCVGGCGWLCVWVCECGCVCVCFLSRKEQSLHQVQERSREGPRLSRVRAHPPQPSPSCCLPSEGLPLFCPPAKVHTSPAAPQRGLSPSPTVRAWPTPSHPSELGVIARGLWVWPPGLNYRGPRLGRCPEKGGVLAGRVPRRTPTEGGLLKPDPEAGVETGPCVGI